MNIKYHFLIGVCGELAAKSDGQFLIGSIILDTVLIPNEFYIRKNKIKFDPDLVNKDLVNIYHFIHSIWIPIFTMPYYPIFSIGYFIHIFFDIFSHTGIFSTKIFYPFSNFTFSIGRDILK